MAGEFIRVDWHEVRKARGEPTPAEIEQMCAAFQMQWSRRERRHRQAELNGEVVRWTVPQFLVHHEECGHWIGGTARKTQIWRCVDGR
jgi:hypothetical protein